MHVHPAQPSAAKIQYFDKVQHLLAVHYCHLRQIRQRSEDISPRRQMTAGQLTDDEWVAIDLFSEEEFMEADIPRSQVIDPYRCVDEQHRSAGDG